MADNSTCSRRCHSSKTWVLSQGRFVLDYSEHMRAQGRPAYFVGRGRVAGNTRPIPSGLHNTPREAWKAAEAALREEAFLAKTAETRREQQQNGVSKP